MDALQQAVILLVEDDFADQKLIKKSLLTQKIANHVSCVENGEEAFDYLDRSMQGDAACPRPSIILLDLNMPGMGGKEFLKRVKADESLRVIPVVILTTSDTEEDILDGYGLQAAGYIKKPVTLKGFEEVFSRLNEYWFIICKKVPNRTVITCST